MHPPLLSLCTPHRAPLHYACSPPTRPHAFPTTGEEDAGTAVGPDGSFFCSEIRAEGLPVGEGIPSEEDLFAALNCQKGEPRVGPVALLLGRWVRLRCT